MQIQMKCKVTEDKILPYSANHRKTRHVIKMTLTKVKHICSSCFNLDSTTSILMTHNKTHRLDIKIKHDN